MAVITVEQEKLFREVWADPAAKALLQGKAQWEHMGLHAVLREYGDPRAWHSGRVYKEEQARQNAVEAGNSAPNSRKPKLAKSALEGKL